MSGKEKPDILGWEQSRIIKTLFLQNGLPKIYGVVLPLDRRVNVENLADYLKIPKRRAKNLRLSQEIPYKHVVGAIAPFICDIDLNKIGKIIFSLETYLEDPVDFSYPGRKDLSLHMSYLDAFQILEKKYPSLVDIGMID